MIRISSTVGAGGTNERGDVAMVQFALKHAKGGPFFAGSIDGRMSDGLKAAIGAFLQANGFMPKDPAKPLMPARGKEVVALRNSLPASITRYVLHVSTRGGRLDMLLIEPVKGKSGLPKASKIAVPLTDASMLVRSLRNIHRVTMVSSFRSMMKMSMAVASSPCG